MESGYKLIVFHLMKGLREKKKRYQKKVQIDSDRVKREIYRRDVMLPAWELKINYSF